MTIFFSITFLILGEKLFEILCVLTTNRLLGSFMHEVSLAKKFSFLLNLWCLITFAFRGLFSGF